MSSLSPFPPAPSTGVKSRVAQVVSTLLLALAVVLFGGSLLVLVTAPTAWLWIVSILAGEWGHVAAFGSLMLGAIAWGLPGRVRVATTVLLAAAAILYLWPAIQAASIARSLPSRCTATFGQLGAPVQRAPFRWLHLLGESNPETAVTEHVYATAGTKQLKLDLYRSSKCDDAPRPLILVIHGGSWNGGNRKQLPAVNHHLANNGYAVASIDYRHAPKWRFPAAVDDVFRALKFLRANAAPLQIDASKVVLIGRSAGGQIALSAAYAQRDSSIEGVVAFYAPTDLVLGYEKPSRRAVLDSKTVLEDYLGGTPAQKPDVYAAASPASNVNSTTPSTLLIHGSLDPIVWPIHSERLDERLQLARRSHLLLRLPWATHGCDANLSGPSGQLSTYAIDRFLANVLPRPKRYQLEER